MTSTSELMSRWSPALAIADVLMLSATCAPNMIDAAIRTSQVIMINTSVGGNVCPGPTGGTAAVTTPDQEDARDLWCATRQKKGGAIAPPVRAK